MLKKYEKQILGLLALGRRDLQQNGMISIRETIVHADGTKITYPSPETGGVSMNLHKDSARISHKKIMQARVKDTHTGAIFFLHYRVIYNLAYLVKHPNRLSLYFLGMTSEESIFVRQDYTLDDSSKLVFGEVTVLDHDPENEFLDHGYLAERAVSMHDEIFTKFSQDILTQSFPKEWLEYIHRERKNRDEDEWYSPRRATESSITDKKEGGSHEVSDVEEIV